MTEADRAGITAATLDYMEGWYEAAPERMERALHPLMAKRLVAAPQGSAVSQVQQMDAPTLVGYVRERIGSPAPAKQQKDLEILTVYGEIATVRAEMNDWVDLLQLGKVEGRWQIINVLWALKPREVQS